VGKNWPLIAVILLGPLLIAWPLPVVWADEWLTLPSGEAGIHVWGLWATSAAHNLFTIDTHSIAWPEGVTAVLADPANLPWFLIGWQWGPEAAYNTVLYANIALLGLAGAALARAVGGSLWLGAFAGMLNASVLAAATTGITEQLGVGWIGLSIAALLRSTRTASVRDAVIAGICIAMCVASGPYNGVWIALIATGMGMATLVPSDRRKRLLPLGITAATAGALASPLIRAVLSGRIAGQPGTPEMARTVLGIPAANPTLFRGGLRFGTDLTDPFLPVWMTGGAGMPNHTAYLGAFALIAGVIVVFKRRRLWPWLAGAVIFSVLSLGPWLVWKGVPMRVGGEPLLAPAGWMATYLPFFGRISHWHRAGAVAALLLVPLVSLLPTLRPQRWIGPAIGALLLLDRIVGFPVGWPLPSTSGPETEVYASLAEQKGAVLVLPTRFPDNLGPRARWRDPSLMAQLYHGRPISEAAAMGHKRASAGKHAGDLLQQLGKTGRVDRGHRDAFKGPGFVWLAVYNHHMRADASRDRAWRSCLGGAVAQTSDVTLYKLDGGISEQCLDGAQPTVGTHAPGAPQTF
jgi:hypothetical protein